MPGKKYSKEDLRAILEERVGLGITLFYAPFSLLAIIPPAAFALGALARLSPVETCLVFLIFCISFRLVWLRFIFFFASIVGLLLGYLPGWWLVVASSLCMHMWLESRLHLQITQQRYQEILENFVCNKEIRLKEISDPSHSELFRGYFAKQEGLKRIAQLLPKGLPPMPWLLGPPLRVFIYEFVDGSAGGAAVAFPFVRFPSLVFLRRDFRNDPLHRQFQVFHEVAHGTPLGSEIFSRKLRWIHASATAYVVSFLLVTTVAWGVGPKIFSYEFAFAALLFVLGMIFRGKTEHLAIATSDFAGEAVADSIALLHPKFKDHWKKFAAATVRKLDEEVERDPADFRASGRAFWLRIQLQRSRPQLYVPVDNVWFLSATLICLAFSGYLLEPSEQYVGFLAIAMAVIAMLKWLEVPEMGKNGHAIYADLHQKIEETVGASGHLSAPGQELTGSDFSH